MTTETKILELGDQITIVDGMGHISIKPVDKVTPKFAFVGTTKFQREVRGGWVRECNPDTWGQTRYSLTTDKDKHALKIQRMRAVLLKVDFRKLADSEIEVMYQAIVPILAKAESKQP